jgi:hypothetical protein
MFDILSIISGKKKNTQSGWISFNGICCGYRGHKPDQRMRGGIKFDGDNAWTMHCFNCQFKCGFILGKSISPKTRQLLQWCGIEDAQITKWSLESLQHKDLLDYVRVKKQKSKIKFQDHTLPAGELIDINNSKHNTFSEYLLKSDLDPDSYPFLITPHEKGRNGNRIIIPYIYKNKIVGHTSRFLDNKIPKYINEQQPGYVFNINSQKPDWQVCIVTEGIFDALSIDGVAVMHNDISSDQATLLGSLNKPIILVPDRDNTGLALCGKALELGYKISLPNWDVDVKDVNDAVVKYGKLPTLLSILQAATSSKIKIELQRKKIAKGI